MPRRKNSLKREQYTIREIIDQFVDSKRLFFAPSKQFYSYSKNEGVYKILPTLELRKEIRIRLGTEATKNKINEVVSALQEMTNRKAEEINTLNRMFNMKNGMFDTKTMTLLPHSHKYISTVQLQANYIKRAPCPKWQKTLNQIFNGKQNKIQIFQEYFGLCLTKSTQFEKALFCVGKGANGKSTVLSILQEILGDQNYSAVPLEKFDNMNYVIQLFGKLANISIETRAKSYVYDSYFKAIVSGDVISGEAKFKDPIKFKPFCKLIVATNEMPRVEDSSGAFYRRLIILEFERTFQEGERNLNLRKELKEELDGIFYWALVGLARLGKRGDFHMDDELKTTVKDYQRANDTVMSFVEEQCEVNVAVNISKDMLFKQYENWCKKNRFFSLPKITFGKELQAKFPIIDDRTAGDRFWQGIKLVS